MTEAEPHSALGKLVSLLALEKIDDNIFRGARAGDGWQRVYGGQVLGQALAAAAATVEADRGIHSLHSFFILAGDPGLEIIYDVERIRDGGSFATRRVKALQHGRPIFAMSTSYHKTETGFDHQAQMPDAPPPDALPDAKSFMTRHLDVLPANMRTYWEREHPIDIRIIDPSRYATREKARPQQMVWMKANGRLPHDPRVHQAVLAYASDFTLLDTALIAHGKLMFDHDIQLASLDHAMWFHRPFRADEWMLYVQDSPSAFGARGLCHGTVYSHDGRLVASTAQEGLIRLRDTSFVIK